jgi:hypothetical protein
MDADIQVATLPSPDMEAGSLITAKDVLLNPSVVPVSKLLEFWASWRHILPHSAPVPIGEASEAAAARIEKLLPSLGLAPCMVRSEPCWLEWVCLRPISLGPSKTFMYSSVLIYTQAATLLLRVCYRLQVACTQVLYALQPHGRKSMTDDIVGLQKDSSQSRDGACDGLRSAFEGLAARPPPPHVAQANYEVLGLLPSRHSCTQSFLDPGEDLANDHRHGFVCPLLQALAPGMTTASLSWSFVHRAIVRVCRCLGAHIAWGAQTYAPCPVQLPLLLLGQALGS